MLPKLLYVICKIIGFGLLFASWIESGEATGFIPIIALGIMTVIRLRVPTLWPTIFIDGIGLIFLYEYLPLSIFVISELFYRAWDAERLQGLKIRDAEVGKYYELERLQGDSLTATAQIERMTAVSERARIAREIHDNAGHEIVGAYISLQSAREILQSESPDVLELYDAALDRLDSGVSKIREAVHNLAPLTALGVEALREICNKFPVCEATFTAYGDLSAVPMYCWNLLEACLNESLTNIARHATANHVKVDLDTTPNLVRLSIENDGANIGASVVDGTRVARSVHTHGIGLRNLRHRAAAVGGNISIDAGKTFRVICVVPLTKPPTKNEV